MSGSRAVSGIRGCNSFPERERFPGCERPLRGSVGAMNKNRRLGRGIVGALLILLGLIWTLQGLGVIQSKSAMTGETIWAIIGPIVAILGVYLVTRAARARRP